MIEQKYHHFKTWECNKFGMYETTCFMDEYKMIEDCKLLLSCPEWLQECMIFVTHHWQYSAEQFLTNINRNRQAYLGQAACCMMHGAPEYTTKKAWNLLTDEQRLKANDVADYAIQDFEDKFKVGYFAWQKRY
jgi:hypothetical protein